MPPDDTPRQPEALHSETYPLPQQDTPPEAPERPHMPRGCGAGECGDAIWEYDAVEDGLREAPGYDPHAAHPRSAGDESGIRGGRIIDLGQRRERREPGVS
jgi:hypothetical protein